MFSSSEREQSELLVDSAKYEAAMELLKCFRCDLGFWDACYTTETKCSRGERCYTGRGKAGVSDTDATVIESTILMFTGETKKQNKKNKLT